MQNYRVMHWLLCCLQRPCDYVALGCLKQDLWTSAFFTPFCFSLVFPFFFLLAVGVLGLFSFCLVHSLALFILLFSFIAYDFVLEFVVHNFEILLDHIIRLCYTLSRRVVSSSLYVVVPLAMILCIILMILLPL